MINRNQLARVLDPDAWNLPESIGTQLYRRLALERADRLLFDPRWAVLQLPEPDSESHPGNVKVWDFGADSVTACPGMVSAHLGHKSIGSGGVDPNSAMSLAAIFVAASRAAQQTEEQ